MILTCLKEAIPEIIQPTIGIDTNGWNGIPHSKKNLFHGFNPGSFLYSILTSITAHFIQ